MSASGIFSTIWMFIKKIIKIEIDTCYVTGALNDLFRENSILGDFPACWQFFQNRVDIYYEVRI